MDLSNVNLQKAIDAKIIDKKLSGFKMDYSFYILITLMRKLTI